MSTGYLAALAERTLGVAATLRPAAPSRFEPAQLADGGLVEAVETVDARDAPAPVKRPPMESRLPLTHEPVEPRLLPPVDAPPLRRPAAAVPMVELHAAEVTATPVGPVAGTPPTERTPEPARTPAPGPADVPRGVAELARAVAELTGPSEPTDQAGRRSADEGETGPRGDDRSSWAAAERVESRFGDAEPEPSLVVHIGRIEVRAVDAPRPSAPTPRPAPAPAGASLGDYLIARDAGRRR